MFTLERFIQGIGNTARSMSASIDGDSFILMRVYHDWEGTIEEKEPIARIKLEELTQLAQTLNESFKFVDKSLLKSDYFEVAVQAADSRRFSPFMRTEISRELFDLQEHGYTFSAGKASPAYIFALICSFASSDKKYDIGPFRMHGPAIATLDELFNAFRIHTVKIHAPQKHSTTEFKRILDSYLFNVAYNHNTSLTIADYSIDMSFRRFHRHQGGQLFPYKHYKQDLTKYYHQAIATNLPFMQYLAFYHVAEFFFQSISEEEAFQLISSHITRPSFSPCRKEDVRNFYNAIKKKMREQRDDGVWNEKNALLLCLKQYVPDLSALKASIERIDPSAVEYYRNTLVSFTDESVCLSFDDEPEKLYTNLRTRIYATRNAIVHSKDGNGSRYEPFKHDKQLAREIALIRAVAEEIIINSAESLSYNFAAEKTES